jgi:hypothetical protein
MFRHALNCVQHRRLHPAMSALGSNAVAVQTLPQERKSSLQTRTLWLPGPQGDWGGWSDWIDGGPASVLGGIVVCACAAPPAKASDSQRTRNIGRCMSDASPRR